MATHSVSSTIKGPVLKYMDEICSHKTEYFNNDLYIAINIVTLTKRRLWLPDNGLCRPKHVGANTIVLNGSTI